MGPRVKRCSSYYLLLNCLLLVLILVSCDTVKSNVLQENEQLIFDYIDVSPDIQTTTQLCFFRCVISPSYDVTSVHIKLYLPNESSIQYPMQYFNEGFYRYSIIYQEIGNYNFQIIVKINNHSYTSINRSFWISKSKDDKDSDGIYDWWEKKYGFNPENAYDAGNDFDNDGYTNKEEFLMNTNPLRNNIFENAWIELSKNYIYFFISFFFLILLSWMSLFGFRKVHS
jgi:hypothetical protein